MENTSLTSPHEGRGLVGVFRKVRSGRELLDNRRIKRTIWEERTQTRGNLVWGAYSGCVIDWKGSQKMLDGSWGGAWQRLIIEQ